MRADADDDRRPLSPGWRAEDYERGRPGWPDALIDELFDRLGLGPGSTVLDLAAGTGKLTRVLEARATVVAVEPDPAMRAVHGSSIDGTAETIPLAGGSVDAAFVAEAWHWFDPEPALRELARVLRPGGGLALLWNMDTKTLPIGPLRRHVDDVVLPKAAAYESGAWREAVEQAFGPLTLTTCEHEHRVDADAYLALVSSWSWVTALPDGERRAALDELRGAVPPEGLVIAYRAEAWWAAGQRGR